MYTVVKALKVKLLTFSKERSKLILAHCTIRENTLSSTAISTWPPSKSMSFGQSVYDSFFKDKQNKKSLLNKGINVLTIWECEIVKNDETLERFLINKFKNYNLK